MPRRHNPPVRRRRRHPSAPFLMCVVAAGALLPPTAGAAVVQVGPPSYAFAPTGVEGGGFQNVIAVDPSGTGHVVIGGDVSGFSRSLNRGATWATSNRGVPSVNMRQVASLAFSPTDPDTVYAGAGYRGKLGGFLVSEDDGASWELRSTVPQFSGSDNGAVGPLPARHPRSTGALIAVAPTGSPIYAATFDDGVMRSVDGGATWTTIGLAGKYLRSLVMDPADPDTLFAAAFGDGVWRTTSASGPGGFVRLAGAPAVVEELAWVGPELYAAAGANGVYRVSDTGQVWSRLGAGSLPATGAVWTSIGGIVGCDGTILYAGSHGSGAWSVARSGDGGATWAPVTDATIGTTIGGPAGDPWWLAPKKASLMLGGAGYTAGQLAVLPPPTACGAERVLLAGRSGVWGTADGGASWYPMVAELGTTITHAVEIDPAAPGRISIGVADWAHLFSSDGADHVTMSLPIRVTNAYDVEFDTSVAPSRVLLAVGDPNGVRKGDVYSSTDPVGGAWIDEGLSDATGGKWVLGVTAGVNAAGTRVIVAATNGGGVWRKVGGGAWTKGTGSAMSTNQKTKRASLVWPAGSTTVYLYDRQTGVWRSNDAGSSWIKIWAQPSAIDMTGFVAAADGDPSTIFVSVGNKGVYRIDGATSGTVGGGLAAVPIGPTTRPGPIAVNGGLLAATRVAGSAGGAELYVSDDRGATWTPVGDAVYGSAALSPRDLAIAPDGTLYAALNGAGLLRGTPAGA